MPSNRKTDDERTPADYQRSAEDSIELAKVLAGEGAMSDQDFLERMARSDLMVDDDGETCGMCHNIILGAEVAREMIEAGEYENVVGEELTYRQHVRNIERCLTWEGTVRRKCRKVVERFLGHHDLSLRAWAEELLNGLSLDDADDVYQEIEPGPWAANAATRKDGRE